MLKKTANIAPHAMRKLCRSLERKVKGADHEWNGMVRSLGVLKEKEVRSTASLTSFRNFKIKGGVVDNGVISV